MNSLKLLELLKTIIHSPQVLISARKDKKAFIRKRKMPFNRALCFLLDMRTTTLQTRLNAFFQQHGGEPISQQAFSKLRANFNHSPFETMLRTLVKKEYSGESVLSTWNDYHLLSVDGSYLQLPRVEELRKVFGLRDGSTCPHAGISALFDVLHGWVLDPIVTDGCMNERTQFEKHMDFLSREFPDIAKKTIFLCDRGYPSQELFQQMQEKGFRFVARCASQFLKPINTAPMGDSVVVLRLPAGEAGNGVSVRIIKFFLNNGDIETLATNLFDVPMDDIIELYTLRWDIETMYFKFKRELCVEKFSGKTANSIRQDFWASMVLLNSVAVFQKEADLAVFERQKDNSPKYEYRARTSDLIITLRDRLIFAALCGDSVLYEKEMKEIIKTLARAVSPVRKGRSFPRIFKPYYRVNHNLSSHL